MTEDSCNHESSLFICKNKDPFSRNKLSHHRAKTFPVAPVHGSQVLGRVKDFLEVISEANRRLEIDAKDLMRGVADLHTPEAIAATESSISVYKPVDSSSASSSGTDSEDSSDDDEDDDDSDGGGYHNTENTRVLGELRKCNSQGDASTVTTGKNNTNKQSKRPKIVELP